MSENKIVLDSKVDEALERRLNMIFEKFDNIIVPFNGDDRGGLLLNYVLEYKRKHGYSQKISVFYVDPEAQYANTTEYIIHMFEINLHDIEPYWFCVPITFDFSIPKNKLLWTCWNPIYKEVWVRELPSQNYIISLDNSNIPDFYTLQMSIDEFTKSFFNWYANSHNGNTVVLRSSTINDKRCWITLTSENYHIGYPIYDFEFKDIWIMNNKQDYYYNDLYNLFWKARFPLPKVEIPSSHNVWDKTTLNIYRVLDPDMWARILGRIEGSNFGAFFTGARDIDYLEVKLQRGDTWEHYCAYLLSILPEKLRNGYIDKFQVSIRFWTEHGGVVEDEGIKELEDKGYPIIKDDVSKYSKHNKINIIFKFYPDNTDDITATIQVPSWKRMAFCILKCDYICQRMGFARTKEQCELIKMIINRYRSPENQVDKIC